MAFELVLFMAPELAKFETFVSLDTVQFRPLAGRRAVVPLCFRLCSARAVNSPAELTGNSLEH